MVTRITTGLVVVVFFAAAVLFSVYLIMPEPSVQSATPTPVVPVTPASPAPQPELSLEPPLPLFVELFDPTMVEIQGPDGIVVSSMLGPQGGQTNGVLNPTDDQLPSMLVDDGRSTQPGTDQGTVLVIGHSRKDDEGNKFNQLMMLPNPIDRNVFVIALSDGNGHRVQYDAETVLDVEKARFGGAEYRYLQDNRPGRVLLITSWVKGTYPPPEKARIVIGCDVAHPRCSAP